MTSRLMIAERKLGGLACLMIVLAAALLGCVLPQTASAASGFRLSRTKPPRSACPELVPGDPECEAISVPTVPASSAEAIGPELEGTGEKGGFDPEDLRKAYKLPEMGGSSQTVAVVDEYNASTVEADLKTYREKYKLPECTEANKCFEKVNQKGEKASYPANEPEWAIETSLDLDMVSAACGQCHILLVEANGASTEAEFISNMLAAEETAYSHETYGEKTTEISNSWDTWEGVSLSEAEQKSDDEKYLDHPGVPITFASGDFGYYTGKLRWPGSSQYVISVGATKLTKVEKPKEGERAWAEEPWREYINVYGERTYVGETHGAGTTSGCSKYETKPEWQKDKAGCEHRTDVDVAVDGACDSPVSIYDTYVGGWYNECGTSDAAPFLAGVEALSNVHSKSLGAQAFYLAGEKGSTFDVTKGGNGECGDLTGEKFTECHAKYGYESSGECGSPETLHYYLCHAQVGYDGPTGWGAPDGPLEVVGAPSVTTGLASSLTGTGATLNGTVNPEGSETKYYFEYGLEKEKYEHKTAEVSAGSGTSSVEESKAVTGLATDTTYHFRIVATNSGGTTYGSDQAFSTWGTWSTQVTPNPVLRTEDKMTGVACVSSTVCLAVGRNIYTEGGFLEVWNGTEWKINNELSGYTGNFLGISCGSSTSCVIIGETEKSGELRSEKVQESSGHWGLTYESVATPSGATQLELGAVSCSSSTFCMAVGSYYNEGRKDLVETWNGSAWSVQSPPSEGNGTNAMRSVSCSSATSCVTVGELSSKATAEHWNGTGWSLITPSNPTGAVGASLESVSCSSSTSCMAVGDFHESGKEDKTLTESWNGSAWSVKSSPNPSESKEGSVLLGISCVSSTSCFAVGDYSNEFFKLKTLVETWNGTEWAIQSSPNPTGATNSSLVSDSCTSSTACTAVGSASPGPSGETTVTLAERYG